MSRAAIPPVLLEPGLASIFGCGLVFATGVLYGMMSLGKKYVFCNKKRIYILNCFWVLRKRKPKSAKSLYNVHFYSSILETMIFLKHIKMVLHRKRSSFWANGTFCTKYKVHTL